MTNRYILIIGMPRSGTSLAARIIQQLGVDIGTEFGEPNPYCNYEDVHLVNRMKGIKSWTLPGAQASALRSAREYIERRLESGKAVGGKFPMFSNVVGQIGWDTLPIAVVHVERPLNESIDSDLQKYDGAKRNMRGRIERGGEYGMAYVAQQEFIRHYNPVVRTGMLRMMGLRYQEIMRISRELAKIHGDIHEVDLDRARDIWDAVYSPMKGSGDEPQKHASDPPPVDQRDRTA